MKSKSAFLAILFLTVSGASLAFATGQFDVTCTGGSWTVSLNVANLSGNGGTNFVTPVASAANQVTINVTSTQLSGNWRVDISRTDIAWNAGLRLYARRTADGTGTGTITGGTTYQQITTTQTAFFSGTRARNGITVQYQLDGLSVTLGQNNFTTTVNYTLVDS
jgi:hypothetical protein